MDKIFDVPKSTIEPTCQREEKQLVEYQSSPLLPSKFYDSPYRDECIRIASRFPRIERSLDQFSNFFNRKCWPGKRLFPCSTDCCENGNWFRDNIIELRRKIVINFDCRFLDLDLRVKLKNVWFWILRLNPCLGYFRFIGWLGRDKV